MSMICKNMRKSFNKGISGFEGPVLAHPFDLVRGCQSCSYRASSHHGRQGPKSTGTICWNFTWKQVHANQKIIEDLLPLPKLQRLSKRFLPLIVRLLIRKSSKPALAAGNPFLKFLLNDGMALHSWGPPDMF